MIPGFNNVAWHNIGSFQAHDQGGVALSRIPETLRRQLNSKAQIRMREAAGMEIRFVRESEAAVHITASAIADKPVEAQLFYGDFLTTQSFDIGPDKTTISIESQWFHSITDTLGPTAFDAKVCRIIFDNGQVAIHAIQGDIRPPTEDQCPALTMLSYGTSITQGASAQPRYLAYAPQTAWRLGANCINLGSAGSAHCEAAMADYIADRQDWDFATLALSTNMSGFSLDEFRQRLAYFVDRISSAHPDKAIICISLWLKAGDLGPHHVSDRHGGPPEAYRTVLKDIVEQHSAQNLHYLHGPDLMPQWRHLAQDMIHPNNFGHTAIAEHLDAAIRKILTRYPTTPSPINSVI